MLKAIGWNRIVYITFKWHFTRQNRNSIEACQYINTIHNVRPAHCTRVRTTVDNVIVGVSWYGTGEKRKDARWMEKDANDLIKVNAVETTVMWQISPLLPPNATTTSTCHGGLKWKGLVLKWDVLGLSVGTQIMYPPSPTHTHTLSFLVSRLKSLPHFNLPDSECEMIVELISALPRLPDLCNNSLSRVPWTVPQCLPTIWALSASIADIYSLSNGIVCMMWKLLSNWLTFIDSRGPSPGNKGTWYCTI